jgi:hypothetical protein
MVETWWFVLVTLWWCRLSQTQAWITPPVSFVAFSRFD